MESPTRTRTLWGPKAPCFSWEPALLVELLFLAGLNARLLAASRRLDVCRVPGEGPWPGLAEASAGAGGLPISLRSAVAIARPSNRRICPFPHCLSSTLHSYLTLGRTFHSEALALNVPFSTPWSEASKATPPGVHCHLTGVKPRQEAEESCKLMSKHIKAKAKAFWRCRVQGM